jgi:MFS family permease
LRSETSLPLWRNRDFLLIWSGQALSLLGTQVSTFALPLLVLALTRSPFQAGLVSTVQRLPYLLLSLPIGAFIDRWNRKSVMLLADSARFLIYDRSP